MSAKDTVVATLVKAIACPGEAPNITMKDPYSARPMARAGPFINIDVPWSGLSGDGKTYTLPTNIMPIIMRRDPLHAWISYDPNNTAQTFSYQVVSGNGTGGLLFGVNLPSAGLVDRLPFDMMGMASNNVYAPHDDILYANTDDEARRVVWIEGSASRATTVTININGTGTSPTATGFIDMYNDNDGDRTFATRFTFTAQALNTPVTAFTITDRDYRSFEITITALGGTTPATTFMSVTAAGTCDVFGHHALPQMTQNRNNITGMKFLAASCKMSNNSPVIDLNGRIAFCQFAKGDSWRAATFGATGGDAYNYVASQQTGQNIGYKKGGYCFLKPDEEADFALNNPFDQGIGGVFVDAATPLRGSGWMIMVARAGTAADTASATASGRIASFRMDWKVVYSTKNIWLDIRAPEESADQWKQAVETISTMLQFYPDPAIQWGTILKTIGSIARLSAPVISALGPYGRAAGTIVGGAGEILGKLGYRTKKTARPAEEQERIDRAAEDRQAKYARGEGDEGMRDIDV